MPPSISAARDVLSTSRTFPIWRRSTVTAPLCAVALRLDAAAHARAAAERRHGRVRAARPVEHGGDFALVARIGDDIGRARVVAREAAREFGVRLAVGVRGAVVVLARAEGERGGRGDARRVRA